MTTRDRLKGAIGKDFEVERLGEQKIASSSDSVYFVDDDFVLLDPSGKNSICKAEMAGPHSKLFFEASKVRVAINSCGGLCPGQYFFCILNFDQISGFSKWALIGIHLKSILFPNNFIFKQKFDFFFFPIEISRKNVQKRKKENLHSNHSTSRSIHSPFKLKSKIGINSVLRSIVLTLHFRYGVRQIIGFKYGFEGFNEETSEKIELTPDFVKGLLISCFFFFSSFIFIIFMFVFLFCSFMFVCIFFFIESKICIMLVDQFWE